MIQFKPLRASSLPGVILVFSALLFVFADSVLAQRGVTYQQLRAQNAAPGLYLDHNVLLPTEGKTSEVWFNFRFGYDVLNFRQIPSSARTEQMPEDARFQARAELSMQIFKADSSFNPEQPERSNAILTLPWRGTAFSTDFDQTQKATLFLDGSLQTELEPGRYAYQPRITLDGRSVPLRRNIRYFTVPDPSEAFSKTLPVYFIESEERELSATDPNDFKLMNYGRSVLYGQNFSVLFPVPNADKNIRVVVDQLNVQSSDTTFRRNVFSEELDRNSHFLTGSRLSLRQTNDDIPYFRLQPASEGGQHFGYITIPNRKFENSSFRLRIIEDDKIIGERFFRSLWIDIPTSLLNIDVAISMMNIILERDQLRELRRGNEQERIRKFREFWSERDPEPETEYNPLMVEFFRRVDIAFDRFTTPNFAGYTTDQGKALIRNGEPDRVTRRLPAGSPAIEIWVYADREFIFEATSGFGEYRLIASNPR
ncbi:MAG: GWxTD domain-containing protein [Balneolales bacterium]|nr:GWxTD domain-containing protein [Balneolales bacterium]